MAKYYLSNSGNDNNDGSMTLPWASLSKINSLKAGDNIYLKRGDTFYGNISTPTLSFDDQQITVSSYGAGEKPIVSCYKNLNISSAWIEEPNNIWKIDLSNTANFTGLPTIDVNIGFLRVDGIIKPNKKWSKDDLLSQWDFYSDNSQYLYIYSTQNPTNLASDIKASPNINILTLGNATKILNLDICGSGGHGVNGYPQNSYIANCDIHEIGGSMLTGTTRYGNGIQLWTTAQDTIIEYNNIYDCYDVAFTMQGIISGIGFKNIKYQYNTDWNNNQSFEVWSKGSVVGTGFLNCKFENNISINAGYGWSYNARLDKNSTTTLYVQMMEAPVTDILIKNNIFYNPRQGVLCSNVISNGNVPIGYVSKDNYIFLKQNSLINNLKTYTIEQYDSYVSDTNLEKDSKFFVLPSTEDSIYGIISSIMNYLGKNTSQIEIFQSSLNNLNGKLEELKNNSNFIRQTSKGVEIQQMNGFIKANGGYLTNSTSSPGDYYAPICKFNTSYNYGRIDMVINYMICANSVMNRNGVGTLNLQIVGDGHVAQIDLDVFEILEFNSETMSPQDFVAVTEVQDGTNITVGLYFNIGKSPYSKLSYQPTLLWSEDYIWRTNYTFYDKATLLTALPSGTQIRPSSNNPTYIKIPKTGSVAPTITPTYIGQEFIDTTNKKVYKAVGLTSSDWILIN